MMETPLHRIICPAFSASVWAFVLSSECPRGGAALLTSLRLAQRQDMLSTEFWRNFLPVGKDFTIPTCYFLPVGKGRRDSPAIVTNCQDGGGRRTPAWYGRFTANWIVAGSLPRGLPAGSEEPCAPRSTLILNFPSVHKLINMQDEEPRALGSRSALLGHVCFSFCSNSTSSRTDTPRSRQKATTSGA